MTAAAAERELACLADACAALERAQMIIRSGAPKAGEDALLALAYCMLTFGEMLKQASRGVVTPAFSGPIALRDKLAHVPHRKVNPMVLAASVAHAQTEIIPIVRARIADLSS